MIITFFKDQGTLIMTDNDGKPIAQGGDDKMLCPDERIAQYIVDSVTYLTGAKFFRVKEGELIQWRGTLQREYSGD